MAAKRKKAAALLLLAAGIGLASASAHGNDGNEPFAEARTAAEPWLKHRLIAHAMGSVDGKAYTNSYDAFMTNYKRGYRLFEVDLIMTSDGRLAAKHDWAENIQPDLHVPSGEAPTLAQFESAKIDGKYRPLSWRDVAELMKRYPDAYVITDTKETGARKAKAQFESLAAEARAVDPAILERVIPEIYNPTMYDAVMAVYPFPHKIYSLYQTNASADSIVAYVKEKRFTAVAMPVYRTIVNPTLLHRLNKLGTRSYVHAVNNRALMMVLRDAGAYGFYTEKASPGKLLAALDTGDGAGLAGLLACISLLSCGILGIIRRVARNKTRIRRWNDDGEKQRTDRGRRTGNTRGAVHLLEERGH
jgi:glycerophosphoryl diester phosphodiesterase